ncbi:MAG: IMP cyclohydrolase [Candidatus Brocadiia bacterium]
MRDPRQLAERNLAERLANNPYPGRGLILGRTDRGDRLVQVYWLMGRSPNSRNRVLATDGAAVWTEAADPAKVEDPRLIIYNALRELHRLFVVSNGDQTDTIVQSLLHGGTFEGALATRAHEPDAPNYTPRIAGLFDLRAGPPLARLALLRRSPFADATDRGVWTYQALGKGLGYCVTTYRGEGKPLPPFEGEPYLLPLPGGLEAIADALWDALDADNKVALCAKAVEPHSLASEVVLRNKYPKIG